MTTCLILRDSEVHDVLIKLSRSDILEFRTRLSDALVEFSTTDERKYQPDPAVITRPNGQKTLFRPYTSQNGPGVKIVQHPPTLSAKKKNSDQGTTSQPAKGSTLHGIIAACDEEGFPKAFMNSDELTAYRTAMSAMVLYTRRTKTSKVLLFGAGKTALWHARLVLALRGDEVEQFTVVNRSADRAHELVQQVKEENERIWKSSATLQVFDPSDAGVDLRKTVAEADAIFCTTGAKAPLFPVDYVVEEENTQPKSRYISSIGSWQPEMVELDPLLLTRASTDGVLIVDDRHSLKECGDLIQSDFEKDKVKELGEWMSTLEGSSTSAEAKKGHDLREGLVVYKSAGVGITDLVAANFVVDMARKAGQGMTVEGM